MMKDLREADYMLACWKYKYRDQTGAASLEQLAKGMHLSAAFLQNWWNVLNAVKPESRFLDLTRVALAGIAAARTPLHPKLFRPRSLMRCMPFRSSAAVGTKRRRGNRLCSGSSRTPMPCGLIMSTRKSPDTITCCYALEIAGTVIGVTWHWFFADEGVVQKRAA